MDAYYNVSPYQSYLPVRAERLDEAVRVINVFPGTRPLRIVLEGCELLGTLAGVINYNDVGQNRPIDLTMRDCRFIAQLNTKWTQGVYIRERCLRIRIIDCEFRNCFQGAISLGTEKRSEVRDVQIHRNRIYDSWADDDKECKPIFARGGDMSICHNLVSGNKGNPANDNDGVYVSGNLGSSLVHGNTLVNAGDSKGALALKGGNVIASDNTIIFDDDNIYEKPVGIYTNYGGTLATGNRISGARYGIVHHTLQPNVWYTNNVITDCQDSIWFKRCHNGTTGAVNNVLCGPIRNSNPATYHPVKEPNIILE